ncbi:MAG: glycosyltransferase WbuB [Planctomycetaceae bacterium]|nr:glycosyltransferase WbuB [Planctomycetaceae bacterium]
MHILFLTPNFPPEVNAGATRQYEHCRRWVAAGHRVTVITPAPNWPTGEVYAGYENRWKSVENLDGVRVVRVWTLVTANQGFLLRTFSFVSYMLRAALCACFTRNVDVLVATSPHFFAGLSGTLTRMITRRPFVLEIRDIWPESVVAVGAMRRSLVIRSLEWLERQMYASATHIVAVGDGYRDKLLERGVPRGKISVVTNGVDVESRPPGPASEELRQYWNSDGKFVCAYVGTVGMAHGLQVVVDAATKLAAQGRDDVVFWIVGDGAERAKLEEEARRRGLTNIRFFGLVSKQDVAHYVARANACLVHLRGTELFGTVIPSKIFEIMEAQTPIIMGVQGEACDIVVNNNAGVEMTPDSADSLLNCINVVASAPERYRCGRDFIVQFYNRDSLAHGMLEILKKHGRREELITDIVANEDEAAADFRRAA